MKYEDRVSQFGGHAMEISGTPAAGGAGVATEAQIKVFNGQREQEAVVIGTLLNSTAESAPQPRPHGGILNVVA